MKILVAFTFLSLCWASKDSSASSDNSIFEDIIEAGQKFKPKDHPELSEWMEKCEEIVGSDEWKYIKKMPTQIYPCATRYIKMKIVQDEIEDSIKRGELDTVFKKYCGRRDNILGCLYDRLDYVKPCLDDDQLINLNMTQKALDAAVEFICSESGDKIALFMAEKGNECVSNHSEEIKDCLKKDFPQVASIQEDGMPTNFGEFLINDTICRNITSAHQCIVAAMSKCDDPTPSNLIDSLLTQAFKVTPCAQTSGAQNLFRGFLPTLLHPYLLTLLFGALTAAHLLL